jgi:hypothetical protein
MFKRRRIMKWGRKSVRAGVMVGLVFSFVLCMGGRADATWHIIHGHGASIQDQDNKSIVTSYLREAIGLKVNLASEATSWIHFAVPTDYAVTENPNTMLGARYIKVRYNIVNALDSRVQQIRVYNGETLVKTFNSQASWNTAGWKTLVLDMGQVYYFVNGMGISIKINSGPDSGTDYFVFTEAGANFVKVGY